MVWRAASTSARVMVIPLLLRARRPLGPRPLRTMCKWPVPLASRQSTLHVAEDSSRGSPVMTDSAPRRIGVSIELKPHAYDPVANPELFDGVLPRRVIAFIIDVVIIAIP